MIDFLYLRSLRSFLGGSSVGMRLLKNDVENPGKDLGWLQLREWAKVEALEPLSRTVRLNLL